MINPIRMWEGNVLYHDIFSRAPFTTLIVFLALSTTAVLALSTTEKSIVGAKLGASERNRHLFLSQMPKPHSFESSHTAPISFFCAHISIPLQYASNFEQSLSRQHEIFLHPNSVSHQAVGTTEGISLGIDEGAEMCTRHKFGPNEVVTLQKLLA